MFSRWRERLFFLTADSLVSIDTEGRRLGDHAFLEVDHDGFNMILKIITFCFVSTAFIEQVPVASHNDDDGADDDMEQVSLASVQ